MITKKQMTKKQREIYDVLFADLKKARKKGAVVDPGAQSYGVDFEEKFKGSGYDALSTGKAVVIADNYCAVCAIGSHFYNLAGKTVKLAERKGMFGGPYYSDYVEDVFAAKVGISIEHASQLAGGFEESNEPRSAWGKVGYRLAQDFLKWQEENGV